jgi:hypothetical protein
MPYRGPDEHWEGVYDDQGWVPAEVLEKIAICMVDGGLNYRDAVHIANREEARRGTNWYPGKVTAPGLARVEPSMIAYWRKTASMGSEGR